MTPSTQLEPLSTTSNKAYHDNFNSIYHPSTSDLSTLPTELLLRISSFLSRVDLACFLLTANVIFTRASEHLFWESLRWRTPYNTERSEILARLTRDLSTTHIFCSSCNILHPLSSRLSSSLSASQRFRFNTEQYSSESPCIPLNRVGPTWWKKWHLGFADIYLVMLRHRLLSSSSPPPPLQTELPGLPLSALSLSTNWEHRLLKFQPTHGPFHGRVFSYEHTQHHYVKLDLTASISDDGNLILRTTQRLWIPLKMSPKVFKFQLSAYEAENLGTGFRVCMHPAYRLRGRPDNNTDGPELIDRVMGLLWDIWGRRSTNNHDDRKKRSGWRKRLRIKDYYEKRRETVKPEQRHSAISTERWRCNECPTSAQLTVYDHGDEGVEMVLDTWQDLGQCRHPMEGPGWFDCWWKPSTGKVTEETSWKQRPKAEWPDETAFSTKSSQVLPGTSGLRHESAPAVLKHFSQMRRRRARRGWRGCLRFWRA
ncbi:hypothetical protein B0H66DRAFT_323183 [Apodospora peruviana]|uniref:F-box domain-containing protein n=1 Tax=Apodospora peruviana TaxID=516989 RepID=A0AAE0M0X6_9PEZI|nr:hypothetical protein B0H66DRAFT_323183 [Apodospora peruviana]